jgi:hypothetical protein
MNSVEVSTHLQNTSSSNASSRRKYPKDTKGPKDEWKALEQHQVEVNKMIAQYEKNLNQIQQKQLGEANSLLKNERLKDKQTDILIKKKEAEILGLQLEQSRMDMARQKQAQSILKKNLAAEYDQDIFRKQDNQYALKALQITEEKRNLAKTRKAIEVDRQNDLLKQDTLHQIAQHEIQKADEKNQRLHQDKTLERNDYREKIADNSHKQLLKEQNYKNFFQLTANNQMKFGDLHERNVLIPQLEKERQIDEVIRNRVNEENQRKFQNEITKQTVQREILNQNKRILEDQMGHKELYKNVDLIDKERKKQERQKEAMDYNEYLRSSKEQQQEHRRKYKDFLDMQLQESIELGKSNRMSKEEKKINYSDLQAYKTGDPKLFSLVPGFLNSKYSNPIGGAYSYTKTYANFPTDFQIHEKNAPISESQHRSNVGPNNIVHSTNSGLAPLSAKENQTHGLESPARKNIHFANSEHSSPHKALGLPSIHPQQNAPAKSGGTELPPLHQHSSPKGEVRERLYQSLSPVRHLEEINSHKTGSKPFNQFSPSPNSNLISPKERFSSTHNPITNPLPFNMQNPYIVKEIHRLSQYN